MRRNLVDYEFSDTASRVRNDSTPNAGVQYFQNHTMSNPRRIAILAEFPWSFFADGATGRGGGQACTWLSQLAAEFAKSCPYEIHWISIDRSMSAKLKITTEWGGQFFHRIKGIKASVDLRMGYRISRWQLLRVLSQIQPEVVHCWGTETAYPIVCGACGVPSILSMQGVLTEYGRIGCLPDIYYWRQLVAWERKYLKLASLVTCESQWGIDRVKAVSPNLAVRQVEYGVHPGFYEVRWKPDTDRPYAIFSGSIDTRKGVDTLIEALALVKERGWKLKLAGHGSLRDILKSRDVPGVEWLGLLSWDELQRQLAGAMCLVLPTRADTSPNVVKEARVIGLPVITTLHGGQAGYIRDGENGLIVAPLEPVGLARALSRLMDDPELARRMGATRHEEDRAYFRPAETARGFLEIYDELLEPATKC